MTSATRQAHTVTIIHCTTPPQELIMAIDTRDLTAELDALEDRANTATAVAEDPDATDEDRADTDPLDEDEAVRLSELRNLAAEVGDEWRHGVTMILEEDFEDYARELAEDIGMVRPVFDPWPTKHIDWTAAADELAADYTSVEWEGHNYFVSI